ncbi:MAG: c-type cytochrome [Verrucomicrobiales bacterium]|nr:c-type cytochrome [Verrucomicrobiales bacterium]
MTDQLPSLARTIAAVAMRTGLGMVFILFGSAKFSSPEDWFVYVPAWLGPLLIYHLQEDTPLRIFHLLGVFEVVIGLQLLLGFWQRASALAATAELSLIVGCVGFDHTGVRDLGLLLGVAIPLALQHSTNGTWTVDSWIMSRSQRHPALARQVAVGWLTCVAMIVLGCISPFNAAISARARSVNAKDHPSEELASQFRTAGDQPTVREEPIRPVPLEIQADPLKVALGRRLFHDRRLSDDNSMACSDCHRLEDWGMDRRRFPRGIRGQDGEINTPTVYNAALNMHQLWDGSAPSLQKQAESPVENPKEMGSKWSRVAVKINSDPAYRIEFAELWPGRLIDRDVITEAIASFERTLLTPNSRFDQWLRGSSESLNAEELRGYQLFKDVGCVSCHQGVNVGGNMFQTMGKFGDYFKDRGGPVTSADLGRYTITGADSDRHKFKVPSLRNIARTAPYFHDGSVDTLERAINTMAHYQLGRTLETQEVKWIASFLESLNGELPKTISH